MPACRNEITRRSTVTMPAHVCTTVSDERSAGIDASWRTAGCLQSRKHCNAAPRMAGAFSAFNLNVSLSSTRHIIMMTRAPFSFPSTAAVCLICSRRCGKLLWTGRHSRDAMSPQLPHCYADESSLLASATVILFGLVQAVDHAAVDGPPFVGRSASAFAMGETMRPERTTLLCWQQGCRHMHAHEVFVGMALMLLGNMDGQSRTCNPNRTG